MKLTETLINADMNYSLSNVRDISSFCDLDEQPYSIVLAWSKLIGTATSGWTSHTMMMMILNSH